MRIDGRFDPKVWVQPRAEKPAKAGTSEEQPNGPEMVLSVSEKSDSDVDFAVESESGYAYTHANRVAGRVAELLEVTPEL